MLFKIDEHPLKFVFYTKTAESILNTFSCFHLSFSFSLIINKTFFSILDT